MAGASSAAKNAKGAKAMKPSGVEWLGDIPEGWKIGRVKNIAIIQNGQDPKTEGDIPVYGSGDSSFKTCGEFKEGPTVLLGRKGSIETPHYVDGKYWNVDTAFDVKMLGDANIRWFYYLAICFDYKAYISQTAVPSMTQSDYRNMAIPLPKIEEQHAIAEYLDAKCGAIYAAIAEAKKGIEEYKAWKKSLIFEAVNGEREKRRLRFLADITTGNKDTQDAEPDGAYPFYVRSPIVERSSDYTFEGPGIMMAGDGAGAGRVFHYAEGKYAVHQRVYRIYNFRGIEGRFLLYSLGAIFPLEMDKGSAQSTVPSVRLPMLKDLPIPLPTLPEQQAIADYLDEKCAAIDAMVAEKEALIADLEAYKKSLIYEVVTGKEEPGAAAPGTKPTASGTGQGVA